MIPGVRLILLGRQGAGKGTQCVRLSRHYVVPHISTGDILRAAVKEGTDLGLKAKEIMDEGGLVPDDIMIGIVAERIGKPDARSRGFVLDGFPRTVHQAEALDTVLAPRGLDLAIDLEVDTVVVLKRLASRRVCVNCGANYSVDVPPKVNWTCDICGNEVIQRADDTEGAIKRRLDIYDEQTAPLIAWYLERDKLVAVSGEGHPDTVTNRLIRAIDHRREPQG